MTWSARRKHNEYNKKMDIVNGKRTSSKKPIIVWFNDYGHQE
jgi:hypothetical protein